MARAVKRRAQVVQGIYEEEEILLALIVKKDYNDKNKCKTGLEEYCGSFKNLKLNLEEIHVKLGSLCENQKAEEKCTGLKDKVQGKCTTFKAKLDKEVGKAISELTYEDCKKHEQQCLFLEGACPDKLKDNCIELRNKCYQKKREEVAEDALLRALREEDFIKEDDCKNKLKEYCLELSKESNELMKKCINIDYTWESLKKKAESKCENLKRTIKASLSNIDNEICLSLLEECYFHEKSCKDTKKPDCDKLLKECQKKVTYIPPGSDFNPTEPEATLVEKIGLKGLYEEAITHGVLIGKAPERDILDLLLLLLGKTAFDENQCKTTLTGKCKSIEHLGESIKKLCDNTTEYANKCKELDKEFKKETNSLTIKIQNKHFEENEITLWSEITNFLTEDDCIGLQSDCFYFENQNSFEKPCKNIKAACYKKGLNALANEALQERLRGKFYDEIGRLPQKFYKDLLEVCVELKNKNKELFMLCIQPEEAIVVLSTDLYIKTSILQDHLNENRDLPTRQHCTELLKKCEDLGQDSREIEWPCRTLRHHCARLGVAEHLEEVLLQEKVNDLDKFESCVETLRGRCSGWGRRGRTRYALGCVAPNATCTYLTGSVGAKCAVLGGRIQTEGIIAKANEQTTKEATCRRWMPFCNKFMSSCGNLTATENKYCKGLKEECKTVIRQLELEEEVIYELKGSLKTEGECKTELEKYCTQWKNATNGLQALCTSEEKGKNDDAKVREELCQRLVEEVKKRCPGLTKRLTEASKELEEKGKEYEDIKKKAVEAMGKANLILSKTKTSDSKAESQAAAPAAVPAVSNTGKNAVQFKLVRRNAAAKAHITEKELEAFDLVSQAFGLYVELKEECHDLLKGCGFRKECEGCKDACEKIDGICSKVKPLEVTEHKNDRHVGHTHIDAHKHIDVHVDDDIDGDADVDPAVQADEVHDRGRGRRGEAEWGAEDEWVGSHEGGVVGDDDFGYDLEMDKTKEVEAELSVDQT
ncbi:hypothetical protein PMAC_000462 [Pneumocystis sp. 'macacae']|nr:hypothetical protein PMAC_000462 [Pneumocystis sp. 'macacae']